MKKIRTENCTIVSKWYKKPIPIVVEFGYKMVAICKKDNFINFSMYKENGEKLFDFYLNDNKKWKLNDVFFYALEKFGYKF